MTAKEMFEKLGYYYKVINDAIIIFEAYYTFGGMRINEILKFTKEKQKWYLKPHSVLRIECDIPVNLLQAINKQIEELGGINE